MVLNSEPYHVSRISVVQVSISGCFRPNNWILLLHLRCRLFGEYFDELLVSFSQYPKKLFPPQIHFIFVSLKTIQIPFRPEHTVTQCVKRSYSDVTPGPRTNERLMFQFSLHFTVQVLREKISRSTI